MTKSEQRKMIKTKMLAQDRKLFSEMSETISDALSVCFAKKNDITVLSYLPMEDEADPFSFDLAVTKNGGRIAYPVCGESGKMEFYIPEDHHCLNVNRYGIREPEPDKSVYVSPGQADLIIVPCVAYGRDMSRLGHGGGYYDRYLSRCPDAKKILISFSVREMDNIIKDENDILMDIIITEKEILFRNETRI